MRCHACDQKLGKVQFRITRFDRKLQSTLYLCGHCTNACLCSVQAQRMLRRLTEVPGPTSETSVPGD